MVKPNIQPQSLLTPNQKEVLDYDGDLTLEALATLDTYTKLCCNKSATAKKLHQGYIRVRNYIKQPYVREIFKMKLLEKGVTPDKLAETIKEGLEASNGVYCEGQHVADEPNWAARQKFAQLAAEIFEVLKYQSKVENQVNNTFIQSFTQLIESAQAQHKIVVPVINVDSNGDGNDHE